jgi:hypothetical protein
MGKTIKQVNTQTNYIYYIKMQKKNKKKINIKNGLGLLI